jgi:hypothetical protein
MMMTVDEYVALPWTVYGRPVREDPDSEPYYLITVAEMPPFSVVARTRLEAQAIFPIVLREFLETTLELGHEPPLPLELAPVEVA